MYTAGIVLSLPLPTLAKPALALKQMTLVPYANSCMCLRKGVHVTILDATLGYSSFTATPLQRPAPFFFLSDLLSSSLVSERHLLSAQCMLREKNKVTQNKSPLSCLPQKKLSMQKNKMSAASAAFVHSPPPHTHALPSRCPDAGHLLCTRAASAAEAWRGGSQWSSPQEEDEWRGGEVGCFSFRPAAPPSGWLADWVTVPAVEVWYTGFRPTVMMSSMVLVRVAGRSCRRRP